MARLTNRWTHCAELIDHGYSVPQALRKVAEVSSNFYFDVSAGNVSGHKIMSAMGERAVMGTTAAGEDVWRGNQLAAAPTSHTSIPLPADAGEQMSIESEHATDTIAGVGAQIVTIEYLDGSGNEQTTTVELNGTTGVQLTPTDVRFVNDMYVSQAGTNGVAVGNLFIYKTGTAGLVYNMIYEGGNKSLVPHRMVPNNKTLYIEDWNCAETSNKSTIARIRADCTPAGVRQQGVYLFKGTFFINTFASSRDIVHRKIPELSVLKVSAWSTLGGSNLSINWWGVLVDD